MRVIRHTIGCQIAGYESLHIAIDIGMTNEQIGAGQAERRHTFVLDFPNWDAVAESLDLTMDKPEMPLTVAGLNKLPVVLTRYIGGGYVINDAVDDYMATVRPFLKTSSEPISP